MHQLRMMLPEAGQLDHDERMRRSHRAEERHRAAQAVRQPVRVARPSRARRRLGALLFGRVV